MFFVGFLSAIYSSYSNFDSFNVHVDHGYIVLTFLDSYDQKQLVNLPICMVTYWTSLYHLPPYKHV